MSWNYRVIEHKEDLLGGEQSTWYGIHEVYYENICNTLALCKCTPTSCTIEPVTVLSDDIEEMRSSLKKMLKAFDLPVLSSEVFEDKS